MLRITIEVWPHGLATERREIAAVAVGRVGVGEGDCLRYAVLTSGDGLSEPPRAGVVAHRSEDGCLALLQRALEEATVDGHSELQDDQLEILRDALRSDADRSADAWQQLREQVDTHPDAAALPEDERNELLDGMAATLLMGGSRLARRPQEARELVLSLAWSYGYAAEETGMAETDLEAAVRRGDLVQLRDDEGVAKLPSWQFAGTPPSPIPGIAEVVANYAGNLITLDGWMRRPNPALRRRTPAEALHEGDVAEVVTVAIAGV
ncbi:MAG: hypothetical protein WD942_03755 [Dehalococcoidia bacterium]